jgi:Ca2+-binding RTX toxin-like protein
MAIIHGTSAGQTLKGGSLADTIYGLGGDDFLYGYGGNDILDGGTGIDTMAGGTGNDTYYVDNQEDRVIELAGQGTDTIRTSTHYQLWWDSNVELLTTSNPLGTDPLFLGGNDGNNRIEGNAGANYIRGEGGADVLLGGGGNDVLNGGPGSDRLTGGSGKDVFVFSDLSQDTITDFVSGVDKIDLGWWGAAMGGTSSFRFIGSAAFSHHNGQARYADGHFQLDMNGDGIADLTIAMGAVHAGDFVFAAYGYWDY